MNTCNFQRNIIGYFGKLIENACNKPETFLLGASPATEIYMVYDSIDKVGSSQESDIAFGITCICSPQRPTDSIN